MYKKASGVWKRLRTMVGQFGPPIRSKNNDAVREGKRAARAFLSKQKKNRPVTCTNCNLEIPAIELSDHLFTAHQLAICAYCRTLVEHRRLHKHIADEHGKKRYERWLRKINGKKRIRPTRATTEADSRGARIASAEPKAELVQCTQCRQSIDANLVRKHLELYCRGK